MLTGEIRLGTNAEEVAAKVLDGEAIIINLTNGMYYSAADAGAMIWTLFQQGMTLAEVSHTIADHYGIERDAARIDVERIAAEFLSEKLVSIVDVDGEASAFARVDTIHRNFAQSPAGSRYEPARLHKYDDMVEMLALDLPLPELRDAQHI